jgi:hypothetical protein
MGLTRRGLGGPSRIVSCCLEAADLSFYIKTTPTCFFRWPTGLALPHTAFDLNFHASFRSRAFNFTSIYTSITCGAAPVNSSCRVCKSFVEVSLAAALALMERTGRELRTVGHTLERSLINLVIRCSTKHTPWLRPKLCLIAQAGFPIRA